MCVSVHTKHYIHKKICESQIRIGLPRISNWAVKPSAILTGDGAILRLQVVKHIWNKVLPQVSTEHQLPLEIKGMKGWNQALDFMPC